MLLSLVLLYWMRVNDAARHSEHAVFTANTLERLLYEIDSAVRGFRLTEDRSLLSDYQKNKSEIDQAIEELSKIIDGHEPQHTQLAVLRQNFAQWQALEDACLARPGPTDPKGILAQADAMQQIRGLLSSISAAESMQKSANYDDQRQATITAVLSGIGFSMLMGIALALINRRTVINLSQAYQQALTSQITATQQYADAQQKLAEQREKILADERAAHRELLRNGRVKDEFLATLSHELRTPMTAILGWAKLLRDPSIRDTMLTRAIDAIDSSSRAQARLIDDLLDMSRIMSGKLAIKSEPMDFRTVVSAAIESIMPAATNKKLNVRFTSDDAQPLIVHGDSSRLQQVVWNLLTNAVKFTPDGGSLQVSLRRVEEMARFSVTDNGQGIEPAFLSHVFERFRQADGSTTRIHGGLGLGLAIVKNLVELHGGTVEAHSDGPGSGSTFSFSIPLARAQAPTPTHDQIDSTLLSGKKMLLVDDDVDAAFVWKTMLEQLGAKVVSCHSADQALAAVRDEPFDLIFSDIGMPMMDGYGLIAEIRRHDNPAVADTPAVALTAFARPEDRSAAYAAGFNAHLAKPVLPKDLRECAVAVLKLGQSDHASVKP